MLLDKLRNWWMLLPLAGVAVYDLATGQYVGFAYIAGGLIAGFVISAPLIYLWDRRFRAKNGLPERDFWGRRK